MSYERPGAGRDFTGAADCRRAFVRGAGRAGSTGFQALGGLALRGGRCGSRAAARSRRGAGAGPDAGTDAGPDAGTDAGTGTRASGTAAGSVAFGGGNGTNGRAASAGSGGSPRFPAAAAAAAAAAGAAPGASGTGEGYTVTHPEVMTSAASVRGRARRSCIRPPCRTGGARTGTRHTVG